jgi:histidine triad (HIT) family protein
MTQDAASTAQGCTFCAIAARQAEASVVHEDETVVAFMDLNPVTPGHLLVVPRKHAAGLEDLDGATSAHVWSVGHDMARALRRSGLRCEGINVFVCDGEAAFQTVFHFHLHVIPRYAGDGWTIIPEPAERERSLLDNDAQAIKGAIAMTNFRGEHESPDAGLLRCRQ